MLCLCVRDSVLFTELKNIKQYSRKNSYVLTSQVWPIRAENQAEYTFFANSKLFLCKPQNIDQKT